MRRRAMVSAAILALAVASVATRPATHIVGADQAGTLPACAAEDGSTPGQSFPCRWDAARQGNGRGVSFTLTAPVDYDPAHLDPLLDPPSGN